MIRIVNSIGPGFETKEEIKSEIEKSAQEGIWGIELRADILSKLKPKINLEEIIGKCKENNLRTIMTNGSFNLAINNAIDYISTELDKYEDIKNLDLSNTKLIISYHNQEETPKKHILEKKYSELKELSPYIVKIATMANDYSDNLTMYNLISHAKEEEQEIIGICMGEKGSISRIQGPILGSFLTFATLDSHKATAPGQLTIREMKEIYGLLKVEIGKEVK